MSTLNPLNDISRTYLDTIAKMNKKEEETEVKRWEGELNLQMKTMANLSKEDKDYGYDKKGNSLNPADMEEKRKKDDDLAGAPNKNGKNGKKKKRWWDDDGDGKGYEKGEVKEAVYGRSAEKVEASRRKRDDLAGAPLIVTNADKKANTKAYQNLKAGHKGYKAADHLKNESAEHRRNPEGSIKQRFKSKQTDPSKAGFTGIGDDIGEIMRQNAAMKKAAEKKTKKEGFSDWRQDLKEIPDYEQIPASTKKRNEKISEKNVKNTVKINPEMKEEATVISETEIEEGVYEKQKTKEVMGALKKRDLKTSVKKKIAADIVKKKGDTSKSDDRYAYESKLWDQVAENLTELGELGGVKYKVVPLDESDIADILARLEKKRISKGGNPDESPLGKKTGRAMKAKQDEVRKKAGVE